MRLPQLVRQPQFFRLPQYERLHQLLLQVYLGWQPHLKSIPHTQLLILASPYLAVLKGVPHFWPDGSAGMPVMPATISISECLFYLVNFTKIDFDNPI